MINQTGRLFLIVLLIVLAIGGYLVYSGKINLPQKQTQTSQIDETANWKTYTNTIYGFSLKYPEYYVMQKCGGEATQVGSNWIADGTEVDCVYPVGTSNSIEASNIGINFSKGSKNSFISNKTAGKGTLTTINGKPAYITFIETTVGSSSSPTVKTKVVDIAQSANTAIELVGFYDKPSAISLFDTILSSFKFTQYEVIDNSISPDGSYTVIKSRLADHLKLSIQDKNGKVIVEDIISLNVDQIWKNMEKLGLKGRGQVGYFVKEWKNNSIFVLQISPASGDEFEVEVSATTGKIDESAFKKVN